MVAEGNVADLIASIDKTFRQIPKRFRILFVVVIHERSGRHDANVHRSGAIPQKQNAVNQIGGAPRRVPANREHLDSGSLYIQILAVPETARDRNLSAPDGIGIGFKNVDSGIGEGPGASGVIVMTVSQENCVNVLCAATESFKCDPNRACLGIHRAIDQPVASISEFKKIRPDRDGSRPFGDNRDPPVGKLCAIL